MYLPLPLPPTSDPKLGFRFQETSGNQTIGYVALPHIHGSISHTSHEFAKKLKRTKICLPAARKNIPPRLTAKIKA